MITVQSTNTLQNFVYVCLSSLQSIQQFLGKIKLYVIFVEKHSS